MTKGVGSVVSILQTPIDALTTDTALLRINHMLHDGKKHLIVTANPEILYRATFDKTAREHLDKASMRTADGIGVLLGARILGQTLPCRLTGVGLAEAIVKESSRRHWRIFLLGAKPGVAEEAQEKLLLRYPEASLVGAYHGYFTHLDEVLPLIEEAKPEIIFVAMGSPRQEAVALNLLEAVPSLSVAMGVGGSFDVFSGRVRRAPVWIQRIGFEWCYRLITDPKRLRRAGALPKFALAVVKERFSKKAK